jgi:hypothetical protein
VKFVSDQPNGIRPGTVGGLEAHIAKRLVGEDPTLISPERRVEFMEKIETIYTRDHAVFVTLSNEEIGLAQMAATHETISPRRKKRGKEEQGSGAQAQHGAIERFGPNRCRGGSTTRNEIGDSGNDRDKAPF